MRILGIDPGLATMGYGVVDSARGSVKYVECGVITTPARQPPPDRMRSIYDQLTVLLDRFGPDVLATERLFFSANVTTAFEVGRAVGVVLLAAAERSIPWTEYRPVEIKVAVAGYGGADKQQVQYMVRQLLSLATVPRPDDAADALAVAICHAHTAPMKAREARG